MNKSENSCNKQEPIEPIHPNFGMTFAEVSDFIGKELKCGKFRANRTNNYLTRKLSSKCHMSLDRIRHEVLVDFFVRKPYVHKYNRSIANEKTFLRSDIKYSLMTIYNKEHNFNKRYVCCGLANDLENIINNGFVYDSPEKDMVPLSYKPDNFPSPEDLYLKDELRSIINKYLDSIDDAEAWKAYFCGGMLQEDVAEVVGQSLRTIKRKAKKLLSQIITICESVGYERYEIAKIIKL